MKKFIEFGCYYGIYPNLVKTICRAIAPDSGQSIICFSKIEKGGICRDTFFMPEDEFKSIYCA